MRGLGLAGPSPLVGSQVPLPIRDKSFVEAQLGPFFFSTSKQLEERLLGLKVSSLPDGGMITVDIGFWWWNLSLWKE